ncbi:MULTISPECIES: hypothetical protein [Moorena]|nr:MULTISPECIES: hypothetical protein [Moorena]
MREAHGCAFNVQRSAVSGQRSAVSYFIQQLFGLVWLFAFSCSV